jgi:hypothetical protein
MTSLKSSCTARRAEAFDAASVDQKSGSSQTSSFKIVWTLLM